MELSGKMTDVLEEVTGQGKNGMWKKRGFIVETDDKYPKKVHFSAWGDIADVVKNTTPGGVMKVSFELESKEYNGKWYTDAKAYKIEGGSAAMQNTSAAPSTSTSFSTPAPVDLVPISDDEMPF